MAETTPPDNERLQPQATETGRKYGIPSNYQEKYRKLLGGLDCAEKSAIKMEPNKAFGYGMLEHFLTSNFRGRGWMLAGFVEKSSNITSMIGGAGGGGAVIIFLLGDMVSSRIIVLEGKLAGEGGGVAGLLTKAIDLGLSEF